MNKAIAVFMLPFDMIGCEANARAVALIKG
jgi:hypothetical protein